MKKIPLKRIAFEFLNTKYRNVRICRQIHELNDRRVEKFITNEFESIVEFTYYYSGKERRTRVNNLLRQHINKYIDIHYLVFEIYVLEWCYDHAHETIEM